MDNGIMIQDMVYGFGLIAHRCLPVYAKHQPGLNLLFSKRDYYTHARAKKSGFVLVHLVSKSLLEG